MDLRELRPVLKSINRAVHRIREGKAGWRDILDASSPAWQCEAIKWVKRTRSHEALISNIHGKVWVVRMSAVRNHFRRSILWPEMKGTPRSHFTEPPLEPRARDR